MYYTIRIKFVMAFPKASWRITRCDGATVVRAGERSVSARIGERCGRYCEQLPAPFKPDVSRTFFGARFNKSAVSHTFSTLVSTTPPFPALFGPF